MASLASAQLLIRLLGAVAPGSPRGGGPISGDLSNGQDGRRWTDGQANKNVDRIYRVEGTLASGGTDLYNFLAAGSLTDIDGRAIDFDEIKAIVVVVNSGTIGFKAPASDFLPCFGAAADLIKLAYGTSTRCLALDFGDDGLSLGTSGSLAIAELGSAAATYSLAIAGAN